MLELSNLPNDLTAFDLKQIEELKINPDFTLRLYNKQMHYTVKDYDKDSNHYTVTKPTIFIHETVDKAFAEETLYLPAEIFSFIPLDSDTMFEAFKSDLNFIAILDGEDLNLDDPFISDYQEDLYEEEYVIYEPSTNVFVFYNPQNEHPYKVIHNDTELYFDSLDLSLKYPFESALKNDYQTPSLRKKLKLLDEYLESESGEEFINRISEGSEKQRQFVESGNYDEMILKVEEDFKMRKIESISSEDFHYLKDLVAFIDEEDFHLLVNTSLAKDSVVSDDSNPFENYKIRVGNLQFEKMIGQGIVSSISLVA